MDRLDAATLLALSQSFLFSSQSNQLMSDYLVYRALRNTSTHNRRVAMLLSMLEDSDDSDDELMDNMENILNEDDIDDLDANGVADHSDEFEDIMENAADDNSSSESRPSSPTRSIGSDSNDESTESITHQVESQTNDGQIDCSEMNEEDLEIVIVLPNSQDVESSPIQS